MNKKNALKVEKLTKIYSKKSSNEIVALNDLNLEVKEGEIFGLLGPNGAGKTTFLNILAGTVIKNSGNVNVWGFDLDKNARQVRASIGIVPQEVNLDAFFSPRKLLELQAGLYGIPKMDRITNTILKLVSLEKQADSYARSLSGGMKRRLLIAKAMVHRPPILILDEPTAGVDVELRQLLWKEIKKLNSAGVTIILTTHYLQEAEAKCDRLAIINKGKVVAEGITTDMISKLDKKELIILLDENKLKNINVKNVDISFLSSNKIKISFKPSQIDEGNIIEKIQESGTKIKSIISREPDLEELFLELTKKTDI